MKWGQIQSTYTHVNVARASKCAVVIFFISMLTAVTVLLLYLVLGFRVFFLFFHSFESIKYEICFYSFGGY